MRRFSDILDDLEFVAKIPAKSKPCFSDKTYIGVDDWFVTIRRRMRWTVEKGEKGVEWVNNLLDSCDSFYRMCSLDDEGVSNSLALRDALNWTLSGLKNIIETYKYDKQHEVSKGYLKCFNRAKHISISIDYRLTEIMKLGKTYFNHYPTKITSKTKKSYLLSRQKFKSEMYQPLL